MKKWMALLLAGLLLLCGCDNTPEPVQTQRPPETAAPATQPDLQQVELTLWVVDSELWAQPEALDALMEEFHAYYPNIQVQVAHHTAQDLDAAKPDMVLADGELIAAHYAQGTMADLSGIWDNGLSQDAYPTVKKLCAGDEDGFHTVPMGLVIPCMAVNLEAFSQEEAISYLNTANHTWNTTSFFKAVQTLHDTGLEAVGRIYGGAEDAELVRLLVENLYDGSFLEKNGTYTVSSEEMSKAFAALAEQQGIVIDAAATAQDALEEFLAGESAFLLNWNSALQLEHGGAGNILFMNYPSADSRPETWAQAYGFGVFDNGDPVHLAASQTFVAYMSANAGVLRSLGLVSARESLADAYQDTDLAEQMQQLNKLVPYLQGKSVPGTHWDEAQAIWQGLLTALSTGDDWPAARDDAQKEFNALFPELFPPETETTAPMQ